jgi:AcrR family transcriptional regulator
MGITERREREKTERKDLILRCAKDLILKHGVEKVSMMDIAKEAELSKATLYLYFPSKDYLFREICDAAGIRFIGWFQSLQSPGLTAMEILKLYWKSYVELFGHSDEMIIIFSMRKYLTPDYPFLSIETPISDFSAFDFFKSLRDLIRQGIEEGTFERETDPDVIARTILSMFSFIIETATRIPKKKRDMRLIMAEMKNLFQIVLRGIAREGVDRTRLLLEVSGGERYQENT